MPEFISMLNNTNLHIAGKGWLFLTKIGRDAIPALVPVLSSTNDLARALAVAALGEIGADARPLIPKIQSMLSDHTHYVRLNAAVTLGKLGDDPGRYVPVLVDCTHQGD